jgi:hypothetical protein
MGANSIFIVTRITDGVVGNYSQLIILELLLLERSEPIRITQQGKFVRHSRHQLWLVSDCVCIKNNFLLV